MLNPADVLDVASGPQPVARPAARRVVARPGFLLAVALLAGFVMEALLHGQAIATGYLAAVVVVLAACAALAVGLRNRPSSSAFVLLACFLLVSIPVALRASATLRAFDVLFGLALLLLAAFLWLPGGLVRLSIAEYAVGLVSGSLAAMLQAFLFLGVDVPQARQAGSPRPGLGTPPAGREGVGAGPLKGERPGVRARARGVLWGLLLAIPALLLFGSLFAAADPVFASYVSQVFDWHLDIGDLVGRVVLSLVLAWLALGLARYALAGRAEWRFEPERPAYFYLGTTPVITVLALLNALFAVFVIVQGAYLFGGLDTLAQAHITHSEYARQGFFQLCAVAALAVSLILLVDWLVGPADGERHSGRRLVDWLHALLIALTLVILVSALYRMGLYVEEYGLTELRFYTSVFMAWLGLVLVWLAVALLLPRGRRPAAQPVDLRRRNFAFGALAAGMVIWLGVNILNPDDWIARANLARAAGRLDVPVCPAQVAKLDTGGRIWLVPSGSGTTSHCLDVAYLSHLSADAVPAMLDGMAQLPDPCSQAMLAAGLQAQAGELEAGAARQDWRGTTLSAAQARAWLNNLAPQLAEFRAACPLAGASR